MAKISSNELKECYNRIEFHCRGITLTEQQCYSFIEYVDLVLKQVDNNSTEYSEEEKEEIELYCNSSKLALLARINEIHKLNLPVKRII